MADFETTTDPMDCRVWGWGLVAIDKAEYENVEIDHTLEQFMERIQKHNANVYFHNLKFDGTFIIDYLLRDGYEFTMSKFKTEPGKFKALISNMGKFYSITVCFRNGKTVEFRDSAKKFPAGFSVDKIGKVFNQGETKGEIDYEKPRPVGYVMDDEERDYLIRDILVVAKALQLQFEQGSFKLTVASDSLADYKKTFGEKRFKRVFPILPVAMDAEIRLSYRGGFTYADERWMGKRQGEGIVLDVNSLYPSVMRHDFLPYGEPRYQRGRVITDEQYPLAVFSVTFTAKLKPKHIPCIQLRGQAMYGNAEYIKNTKEPETLWVTSVDWELWNEHYEIEVLSYNGGWTFRGTYGLFDDYIDKWMAVKACSTGGLREIAKMRLNALYGRFGTNPNVTGKIPKLVNDHVAFELGPDETRAPVYTAMACFITAYARKLTITAAQQNYDTFAYADTDSLHLLRRDTPRTINVHPTELGAWKFEYAFKEALYVRSKFYLEKRADGTYHNAAAGIPTSVSGLLTFEDVWDGNVIDRAWVQARTLALTGDEDKASKAKGKLSPSNVPGGVVLSDTPWTIKF
ncbi:DNA polymerase type B [Curtobacterium phage Ayka]|nr:DNA polymerase type B [Curtobacterium phage Ayka]